MVAHVFMHTYVCMHVCFVHIALQKVIATLKTMLLFKTSEGVEFTYLGMFWYLYPVFTLCATELPTGSELLGVKWNNPLVPPACRESFVSKELKAWILI